MLETLFPLKTSGIMFMAPFIPTVSRICRYKNDGRVTAYTEISQLNNQKKDNSLPLYCSSRSRENYGPIIFPLCLADGTFAVNKRFPPPQKRDSHMLHLRCEARKENTRITKPWRTK